MNVIKSIFGKVDVSKFRLKKKSEKPTLLKEVMDNPEKFKLEAVIEGDEIVVKIKKRGS